MSGNEPDCFSELERRQHCCNSAGISSSSKSTDMQGKKYK